MIANVWHFPHMCGKSHRPAYFPLSYLCLERRNLEISSVQSAKGDQLSSSPIRSTTIATNTNTNNSMDDLDRLLDEAEMVYSTASSKKKTSLKVNKEESEDSLNDDVSRYKPTPTITLLFFFLLSESWRSLITSQKDLHNKNLCL